jgi:hypothetical protein
VSRNITGIIGNDGEALVIYIHTSWIVANENPALVIQISTSSEQEHTMDGS